MMMMWRMECIKHSLLATIVAFGLILSLEASTFACWGIALVVMVQVVLFLQYDTLSTRQQQYLQQELDFCEACVRDHFPQSVRQRLREQQQQQQQQKQQEPSTPSSQSQPIFDVHSEATVLFADLQGFTQWSHQQSPQEVFLLLETLWEACDQLSVQHGVQKVETVGDCYVAVATGTPENNNHASRMATFALDVIARSARVLSDLEATKTLVGTSQLKLRVGVHSGPLVMGVLRGAKRRYQLFGDTVNVASRMESTGCAGQVQISSTTAKHLQKQQQQKYIVTLRQDRIVEAKGLGRVVTYWLEPVTELTASPLVTVNRNSNSATIDFLEQLLAQTEQEQAHELNLKPQPKQKLQPWYVEDSMRNLPAFPPVSPRSVVNGAPLWSNKSNNTSTGNVVVSRPKRNLFLSTTSTLRSRSFSDVKNPHRN